MCKYSKNSFYALIFKCSYSMKWNKFPRIHSKKF